MIKNEPKYKISVLQKIREQLEHRAFWLYLLCNEAKKKGVDWEDFAPEAITECGLSQGKDLVDKGGTDSLKGLRKTLFTKAAQFVFEMDVKKSTDDELFIDFHYCPLVKAWQKAGCSDEEIARLCDIAMCGDHGIGERYNADLILESCIAKGDDICALRYKYSYLLSFRYLSNKKNSCNSIVVLFVLIFAIILFIFKITYLNRNEIDTN